MPIRLLICIPVSRETSLVMCSCPHPRYERMDDSSLRHMPGYDRAMAIYNYANTPRMGRFCGLVCCALFLVFLLSCQLDFYSFPQSHFVPVARRPLRLGQITAPTPTLPILDTPSFVQTSNCTELDAAQLTVRHRLRGRGFNRKDINFVVERFLDGSGALVCNISLPGRSVSLVVALAAIAIRLNRYLLCLFSVSFTFPAFPHSLMPLVLRSSCLSKKMIASHG